MTGNRLWKTFDVHVDADGNVIVGVKVSRAKLFVEADAPVFILNDREAYNLANELADALKRSRAQRGVRPPVVDLSRKGGKPS